MKKTWSVIVCSIDVAKHAHIVQSYERLLAGRQFEIISIQDAISLPEAYNRGVARSAGDIIVFSHDDILILDDDFAMKVEIRLAKDFDILGFAGATTLSDGYWWSAGPEHIRGVISHAPPGARQLSLHIYGVSGADVEPAAALDGLCMIATRAAAKAQRFDEENFNGFHLYDLDFTWSAHLRGLRVGVMTDIPIIHMSTGSFGNVWDRYRKNFLNKHADSIGYERNTPMPEPRRLRARVALFDNVAALRQFWLVENLQRATLGMLRTMP